MGVSSDTAAPEVPDTDPQKPGYRAAIIGTGFMGRVHSQAIRVAGGRVVGVAASSLGKAEEAREHLAAERAFPGAEELLAADDVDVVHICTPNHLHEGLAVAALAAGKHVVCEKPLSTNSESARRMTEAAEQAGRVAAVPFVYRFHPMAREARELVRAGSLGRLIVGHGGYLQDWLLRPTESNWRVDPALGGPLRAFGDIGSHWCDMLEFVSGQRIARVCAQTATVNERRGPGTGEKVATEDLVTLQFATDGGMVGTAVISQVSAGRKNQLLLEISGTEAALAFDQEQPESLWVGEERHNTVRMRDPGTLSPPAARFAPVPPGHPQGYQDCFNHFVADTRAAVGGHEPDGLPVFGDGLRAATIADAVLTSVAERTWVEVPRGPAAARPSGSSGGAR